MARYQDPGLSASRFARKDRPDHTRLLKDIRAGQLDVIILWEPSRGDRKLRTWAEFLEACRDHSVLIYITSHRHLYNMANARDWRSLAEEGIDSAMEVEKMSVRLLRGQASSARDGRPHGVTNYGYERVYDMSTGELTGQQEKGPTPADIEAGRPGEADVARMIIEKTARGYPAQQLIRDLFAAGIVSPTGRPKWGPTAIRRMVLNPVYIGKRQHHGQLYDAIWPPLVDEDVYWAAVAVVQGRPVTGKPGKIRYLLSYLATCGECDDLLVVHHGRGGSKDTGALYACRGKGCTAVRVDEFDRYVELAVWERLTKPDLYPHTVQTSDAETVAARAEAGELRARLDGFTAKAISGEITDASFAKIEAGLLAQISAAEKRAAAAAVPFALRELAGKPYKTIQVKWRAMPLPARRDVVAALFEQVSVKHQPVPRVPGWSKQRERWVCRVQYRGKNVHYSEHTDYTEAETVLLAARAGAEARYPDLRRLNGTYAVTKERVILKLRDSRPAGDTHT